MSFQKSRFIENKKKKYLEPEKSFITESRATFVFLSQKPDSNFSRENIISAMCKRNVYYFLVFRPTQPFGLWLISGRVKQSWDSTTLVSAFTSILDRRRGMTDFTSTSGTKILFSLKLLFIFFALLRYFLHLGSDFINKNSKIFIPHFHKYYFPGSADLTE